MRTSADSAIRRRWSGNLLVALCDRCPWFCLTCASDRCTVRCSIQGRDCTPERHPVPWGGDADVVNVDTNRAWVCGRLLLVHSPLVGHATLPLLAPTLAPAADQAHHAYLT